MENHQNSSDPLVQKMQQTFEELIAADPTPDHTESRRLFALGTDALKRIEFSNDKLKTDLLVFAATRLTELSKQVKARLAKHPSLEQQLGVSVFFDESMPKDRIIILNPENIEDSKVLKIDE